MRDYLELAKPRIALLASATAALGFRLAGGRDPRRLAWVLAGTLISAAATGALNQYLERDRDALMERTRSRPLPRGRLSPRAALGFGLACAVLGPAVLAWNVGPLACGLTALTILSYILLYTPLKTRTPHSTWIGAAAGATPPLIGWAAAGGAWGPGAWALFSIQFLWQIPHFLALFWLRRGEYAAAGFRVMPVVDPAGGATACQIALHSFALLPASLMPAWCGLAGLGYAWTALALGAAFLGVGVRASWTLAGPDARRLFLASLVYLPVLFGALAFCSL